MRRYCYIDRRFEELYQIAVEFSTKYAVNFKEVFDRTLQYRDARYTSTQIREELEKTNDYRSWRAGPKDFTSSSEVWLVFGETGQGKSTFINSLCGSEVAAEGEGINSKTEHVKLYSCDRENLTLIDTPGLFDTRQIKNRSISDEIMLKVQEKLQENAQITAIFFIWCPNFALRLRLKDMLDTLEEALGPRAIESVVFLVNTITDQWRPLHDKAWNEFRDKLEQKGLNHQLICRDVKTLNSADINWIKYVVRAVKPFREADFKDYRFGRCYQKYLEIKQADQEKEKVRQQIENEEAAKYQKKLQEIEKEKQRNQEESSRKLQVANEENQKLKEQILAQQQQQQLLAQQQHQQQQQQLQQQQLLEQHQQYNTFYSQPSYIDALSTLFFDSYPQIGTTFCHEPLFQPTKIPSDHSSKKLDASTEWKYYKGGQFIPGGGHAPKGGIRLPSASTDHQASHNSTSLSAQHSSEAKFYKGGQFLPGGGRAPKGGVWK